jgi:hypothetical protein
MFPMDVKKNRIRTAEPVAIEGALPPKIKVPDITATP